MKMYCYLFSLIFAISSGAVSISCHAQSKPDKLKKIKDELVSLEKKSWEAWKNRDGRFFQEFLSENHVEIGSNGVSNKAEVVSFVGSNACSVKNFEVDHFELALLDNNTALLTYYARQETSCDGKPVPSPVWVSSLYQKQNNHWQNVVYQQSQAVN
jgi:hypothetical protein